MYSTGSDIGGSHIACCMYEHSDKAINEETLVSYKVDTKPLNMKFFSFGLQLFRKQLKWLMCQFRIGIAIPGPFNYYDGISLLAKVDKLESLYGVNVREELAGRLNIIPSKIRFVNDAGAPLQTIRFYFLINK